MTAQLLDIRHPAFLGGSKRLLIGGKWQPAASGKEYRHAQPCDGKVIARLARG